MFCRFLGRSLCAVIWIAAASANNSHAALVAHWGLDEPAGTTGPDSVVDSTTFFNGTPSGGVTFGALGANANTGMAADFDGVDGVINVPYSAPLNPTSFTLTAWALPDTATDGFNSVVTNREDLFPDLGGFVLYNASDGTWQFWTGPGVGAGGWDVLTGPAVATGVWQHVAMSYDATTGTKSLYVDGFLEASAAGGYAPNLSRELHIGAGGDLGNEFRFDGLIDDVALYDEVLSEQAIVDIMNNGVTDVGPQNLVLEINRETGNAQLTNPTAAIDFEVSGYSLLSAAGGLDASGWLSIADNYDADSGGSVDPTNNWTVTATEPGELSEGTSGTTTLAPGATIDLGDIWLQSTIEDVQTEIALAGGSVSGASVIFAGNDGEPFATADLNFDGVIDATDWPIYRDGYRADLSGLSTAMAYRMGDLNLDGQNNVTDYALFKAAFEAANGAGSFAALAGEVPEPATWWLAVVCIAAWSLRRRWLRSAGTILTVAIGLSAVGAAQAELPSLVAHWPLDTDATDVAGGHDGISNAVFFGVDGANSNTGTAANFLADALDTIDVPYSPELNPESFTVTAWALPVVAGEGAFRSVITSRDDQFGETGDTYGYILYNTSGGEWSFWTGAGEGNGLWDALGGGPVTVNEWTHLAASFDAGTQTKSLYVNGELAAQSTTQSYGANGIVGQKNLHIGSGADLGDQFYFDGDIDDVAVFSGVLTQNEVQNVMNNGVAAFDVLRLKLDVNVNSGAATLSNAAGMDQEIDLYEIISPAGALNAGGWSSLADQDYEGSGGDSGTGDGWEELGSPDSGFLGEAFLQGSSVLTANDTIELGNLYNRGVGGEDLVFQYRLTSGTFVEGIVEYFDGPGGGVMGDYNGNGQVEQSDLDLVLLNWGQAGVPGGWINDLPTGNIDQAELDGVLLNWGNTAAVGVAAAVPEPATCCAIVVLLLATGVFMRGMRS